MSKESKLAFLRQSGWVALATTIGGAASYAVHIFAKDMPKADYGVFTTLLQLINLLAIPAIGLQAVFAQKSAETATSKSQVKLMEERCAIVIVVIILWIAANIISVIYGENLVQNYNLGSSGILFVTLITGMLALMLPLDYGVLQGRQLFQWLGSTLLSLGIVRLLSILALFHWHEKSALNGMVAVCAGFVFAAGLASFTNGLPSIKTKNIFRCFKTTDWRDLLRRFIPLSLGGGAVIFMMSVDMVIVQRHFDKEQTGLYAAAGMIGRALIFLVGPLVAVMFPKIVRSQAEQKPTDILKFTLLLTAGLCVVAGALGILLPRLPLQIIYDKSYLPISPLVPWFIWSMVPLALATVLVNNLLARKMFTVVYGLVSVGAVYAAALWHGSPELAAQTKVFNVHAYIGVAKIIGLGNLAFLAVAVGFTWWHHRSVTNAAEAH